jgi:hypothetical protein
MNRAFARLGAAALLLSLAAGAAKANTVTSNTFSIGTASTQRQRDGRMGRSIAQRRHDAGSVHLRAGHCGHRHQRHQRRPHLQ